MERRRFLRLVSRGITGGFVVAQGSVIRAQSAPTPKGSPLAKEGAGEALAASAPGVSWREIKIGMSAAFRGTAAGLGAELYRGAQAYYGEINSRGGVHGRALKVVALLVNIAIVVYLVIAARSQTPAPGRAIPPLGAVLGNALALQLAVVRLSRALRS